MEDIGLTVLQKNLASPIRLSGHFFEVLLNQYVVLETVIQLIYLGLYLKELF